MGDHVELERQVIRHRAAEILLAWDLIVEVIERVQPLVFHFDGGGHTETALIFRDASVPDVKKVLPAVFRRTRLY